MLTGNETEYQLITTEKDGDIIDIEISATLFEHRFLEDWYCDIGKIYKCIEEEVCDNVLITTLVRI